MFSLGEGTPFHFSRLYSSDLKQFCTESYLILIGFWFLNVVPYPSFFVVGLGQTILLVLHSDNIVPLYLEGTNDIPNKAKNVERP